MFYRHANIPGHFRHTGRSIGTRIDNVSFRPRLQQVIVSPVRFSQFHAPPRRRQQRCATRRFRRQPDLLVLQSALRRSAEFRRAAFSEKSLVPPKRHITGFFIISSITNIGRLPLRHYRRQLLSSHATATFSISSILLHISSYFQ